MDTISQDMRGQGIDGPLTWRGLLGWFIPTVLCPIAVLIGVVAPFRANGLQHLDPGKVAGGTYDPKDLWPFTIDGFGDVLYLVGLLAVPAGLLLVVPLVAVPILLSRSWRRTTTGARVMGLATVVLAASLIAFLLTPSGMVMGSWIAD